MRIGFHTNTLNYRGTTVALRDYARFNEEILGNESVLFFDATWPYSRGIGTEEEVLKALSTQFRLVGHRRLDLPFFLQELKLDALYFINSGAFDPLVNFIVESKCVPRTCIHAVFNNFCPQGDRYLYISEWLSKKASRGEYGYVPHIVHLPEPNDNFRKLLNIPNDFTVIGRIGGPETFDLIQVHQFVESYLNSRKDVIMICVGTNTFSRHPRVIYLPPIYDLQEKSNFICACDLMIHARRKGESFGLAIAEFLFHNKPVVCWSGGEDQNHLRLVRQEGVYSTLADLKDILESIDELKTLNWRDKVLNFSPKLVMEKFKTEFLVS